MGPSLVGEHFQELGAACPDVARDLEQEARTKWFTRVHGDHGSAPIQMLEDDVAAATADGQETVALERLNHASAGRWRKTTQTATR